MVAAIAAADSQPRPRYREITVGGFSLEDHWNQGTATDALRRQRWDVVILQQGPSSLDESRVLLIEYARRFATPIRAAGGRPALFAVWPEQYRLSAFDRVSESYALAADSVDGILMPAGEAWRAAWRRDSTLALYSFDQFHPSVIGSFLAALVIYQRIYGRTPVGLPSRIVVGTPDVPEIDYPPALAALLQAAAAEANLQAGPARGAGVRSASR
jgi:hypothetical protein